MQNFIKLVLAIRFWGPNRDFRYTVDGRALYRDEFVTCGGVALKVRLLAHLGTDTRVYSELATTQQTRQRAGAVCQPVSLSRTQAPPNAVPPQEVGA